MSIPPPAPTTKLGIWWMASRPRSLTATYASVLLGAVLAWADDHFDVLRFGLAFIGALALQIAANLLNEYFDYARGSDKEKTQGLGMILARQLLTPRQVLTGGIVTVLVGVLIGLYFVAVTGWVILAIGLGGVLMVILYSAGPMPLSELGLGEVVVFIFMGPLLVFGMYYALAEQGSWTPVWASFPLGFLIAAIMHSNNLRDLDADQARHKTTLSVIFGRTFAQRFYLFLTLGAFITVVLLVILGVAPWTTLIVLVWLPMAWQLCQVAMTSLEVPALHLNLVRTAQLHKRFGFTYVAAWAVYVLINRL